VLQRTRGLTPPARLGKEASVTTRALTGPEQSYCTFRLGDALFGIDVRLVQSVNMLPPLTPVPHAPPAVSGCVNLRGQINLVVDLKRLLGTGVTEPGPNTRLIVFKPALGDPFGILVDRIGDIVELRPDQVEQRGNGQTEADELVRAVGKLDGELLIMLDARLLLPGVERARAD
jgi:chemotaxis signal transduction protein